MQDNIKVGKIVNTHGIKGYLKCIPLTDDIERFYELEYVYTELDSKKRKIKDISSRKGLVFIKLQDIDSINDAEKFKESYIFIKEDQLRELPKNTYYIFDIVGLDVFTISGEYIGKVKEVLQPGANDVYIVQNDKKQYLIPAIKDVVNEINMEEKKIIITPLEGLIE